MTERSHVTVHGPPERVADFKRVFGSATVPVRELLPVPQQVSIPAGPDGQQESRACYFLDLAAITDEQREKLIGYAMERFGMSRGECERELPRGFPILAEQTTFTTLAREFL